MNKKALIFLVIILAVAGFFRFWQLDKIPPGLYPDEAMNGNDALDLMRKGEFRTFYPDNNGREGLFVWLLAFSFWIFGPSIWSIKVVSALSGVLTILGIYLLVKEIFKLTEKKKEEIIRIALLSSLFLAVSFWHVNFSRIAFRAILIPLLLTFGFYFLFRAFNSLKENLNLKIMLSIAASGIIFGLGFYTYISYRFIAILGPLVLLFWWLIIRKKVFFKAAGILIVFMLLTFLPLGIYFLQNPGDFFGRATGVSVLSHETPLLKLGESIISHLAMFNFQGDHNWRHNYSSAPLLLWPVGLLFLLGIALSLKKIYKGARKRNYRSLALYSFLTSWFLIMLFPGFLSAEGIPHSLRVIGAIPPVYIFAGIGFSKIIEILKRLRFNIRSAAVYIPFVILLIAIVFVQFDKYFLDWAKKEEVEHAFSKNYVSIGKYLNSLPESAQKIVVVNASGVPVPLPDGIPMPAQTAIFIERTGNHSVGAEYILPEEINNIKSSGEDLFLIPLNPEEAISREFPNAEKINKEGFQVLKIKYNKK